MTDRERERNEKHQRGRGGVKQLVKRLDPEDETVKIKLFALQFLPAETTGLSEPNKQSHNSRTESVVFQKLGHDPECASKPEPACSMIKYQQRHLISLSFLSLI